jgi:ribosome maturation factor RimP
LVFNVLKAGTIESRVARVVEPVLENMGFELVDVNYLSKQGRWVLVLYIDKNSGVTIDDCVTVSREIGYHLDVEDVIDHKYVLEVSSPGLDRPLARKRDLVRELGSKIKVKMLKAVGGQRHFIGRLVGFENGMIQIEIEGNRVALPWRDVAKANVVYEFNDQ